MPFAPWMFVTCFGGRRHGLVLGEQNPSLPLEGNMH
jgi:hypothetical protein